MNGGAPSANPLDFGGINAFAAGLVGRVAAPPPTEAAGGRVEEENDGGKVKKKQKRYHDPNAPKRALTPFFLYMKENRARIAKELGPNVAPGDVNTEGVKRWREMEKPEKEVRKEQIKEQKKKKKVQKLTKYQIALV